MKLECLGLETRRDWIATWCCVSLVDDAGTNWTSLYESHPI